jgi:hypothetical protein
MHDDSNATRNVIGEKLVSEECDQLLLGTGFPQEDGVFRSGSCRWNVEAVQSVDNGLEAVQIWYVKHNRMPL